MRGLIKLNSPVTIIHLIKVTHIKATNNNKKQLRKLHLAVAEFSALSTATVKKKNKKTVGDIDFFPFFCRHYSISQIFRRKKNRNCSQSKSFIRLYYS